MVPNRRIKKPCIAEYECIVSLYPHQNTCSQKETYCISQKLKKIVQMTYVFVMTADVLL